MIRTIGKVRWVAHGCEVRTEDTGELVAVAASDGLARLISLAPEMLGVANDRWQLGRGNEYDLTAMRIDEILRPIGGAPAWVVQETETRQLTGTGA
jgi:hypothetical protein